jgi:hypothetical protein
MRFRLYCSLAPESMADTKHSRQARRKPLALFREFDQNLGTIQMLYKGSPITSKMKTDDPKALIDGFSETLEVAYQKLRDNNVE